MNQVRPVCFQEDVQDFVECFDVLLDLLRLDDPRLHFIQEISREVKVLEALVLLQRIEHVV